MAQVPPPAGQVAAGAAQTSPEQQPDPHVFSGQQGWPDPPQAVCWPFEQTWPAVPVLAPLAVQLPPTQQPPPRQVELEQQIWPGWPQATQLLALWQNWPTPQSVPTATHWLDEQQPVEQGLPVAQHAAPMSPQGAFTVMRSEAVVLPPEFVAVTV